MNDQQEHHKKLFNELIEVKNLFQTKKETLKNTNKENSEFSKLNQELSALKKRIKNIEKSISSLGDHFYDVYDMELSTPLSETDIIALREEIKEVRNYLESLI